MQVKHEEYDVGVIIGRFQVDELHDGHKELIDTVCQHHDRVIIFLGLAPVANTINNPLDFEMRKQMILAEYPDVTVSYIQDVDSDSVWSEKLDSEIKKLLSPTQSVILYGSRDSFITDPETGEAIYVGKHPTRELIPNHVIKGTDIRKKLAKSVKALPEFRHGVIYASANRFPTVFSTVDVAIFRDDYSKILLGRKEDEAKYRLIGGFADPRDASFEASAIREMQEETGLYTLHGVEELEYLGSYNIDDWRYRGEVDCIRTHLYAITPLGSPKPNDDIAEVRWFDIIELKSQMNNVVPQHHEILTVALDYAKREWLIAQGVDPDLSVSI